MSMSTKTSRWLAAAGLVIVAAGACAQDDENGWEEWLPESVLGRATFVVEEFVPNRVKIEAEAPDRRYGPGDPLRVTVKAEEMFGQPIANKPVFATVSWLPRPFQPEQWEGFTFGDSERKFDRHEVSLPEHFLAEDGQTSIVLSPPKAMPPAALEARVQVTVTEGGRGVTRSVNRPVDPVPFYLGIKAAGNTYARPGQPMEFEVVAVRPDGELQPQDGQLTGTIYRVQWNSNLVRNEGSYTFDTSRELVKITGTSATLAGGRGRMSWEPKSVGNYLIRLGDSASSASVSHSFYVSDSTWDRQPWSLEKPESAELVLDKESYAVGDTARLLIKAPFPGTVLLTLEQDRVVSSTVLAMAENTLEVPITVTEEMLPNVYAVASVIRPVQPAQQWLPHRAVGTVNLPVSADTRVVDVALTAPVEVRPNSRLAVTAVLRDAATSAPVTGDVILWAVDEGVLTLTNFDTPKPGDFFAASRRLMVETADFFSSLMPDLVEGAKAASGTGGGDMLEPRLSPVPNERVKPVVLWSGPMTAGPDGQVHVEWAVPQYMGRLRVMAMAASGHKFGSADADVFVRNPIMLKEHLPRFAAPGDMFTAGMTVYNNTDNAMEPTVLATAEKPLSIDPETSETLDAIAARGQATVLRQVSVAPEQIGQALVTMAAQAGAESYETTVSLPVRPASPRIRLGGNSVVKAGDTASFRLGGQDFLPATTSASLVIGGMPTISMGGAFEYNIRYPYGCTEQVISGGFPLIYLPELARATDADRYSREGIRAVVQQTIDRVLMAQTASGGLSMWVGSREPWEWASVYGAHFLVEAKRASYEVNADYMAALLNYLHSELAGSLEELRKDDATRRAYIGYVLARAGRPAHQRMEQLYGARQKMSNEGLALLAATYVETGLTEDARRILQSASPLAQATATSMTRQTGGILASPVRETALLLNSWAEVDAQSPEAAGLAQRLLQLQKDGRWGTTQENGFALMALGRYHKQLGDLPPVRGIAMVGGQRHEFSTSEPLRLKSDGLAGAEIRIAAEEGTAYAYYAIEGVPIEPPQDPESNGVTLQRRFLDREGNILEPDQLLQGQLVIVELEISGNRMLNNIVLQDLLPAGLEVENARLQTTEQTQMEDEMMGVVAERLDVRDDRVLVFGRLVKTSEGKQTYRYTARAVTPGEYVLPPAMLEVMYDPGISARTAPGRIKVEPRM